MVPAHLVFADINGQSNLSISNRVPVLENFWDICEQAKPRLTRPGTSFYDIDNDSLMAGFSGVDGMDSGSHVIEWALGLHRNLLRRNIGASFGIGLAVSPFTIKWETLPGFIPSLRSHLYFRDDLPTEGDLDRRRLAGDPLIITARLLTLAKKVGATIAFSFFEEAPSWENVSHLRRSLEKANLPTPFPLSEKLELLGNVHSEWMRDHQVEPYGLVQEAEPDFL